MSYTVRRLNSKIKIWRGHSTLRNLLFGLPFFACDKGDGVMWKILLPKQYYSIRNTAE